MEPDYRKREIDTMVSDIYASLSRIEAQTTKHNGRLTRLERYLLIVGCVTLTMLVMSGSELAHFIGEIIF